jgi:glutamyl-tRNA synthetase
VSLLQYRDMGYLPEAMFNFLAILGWSLDDHTEILTREDLIQNFSLERITKAGAIFNLDKLTWMNGMYIRQMSDKDLVSRIMQTLDDTLSDGARRRISETYVSAIAPLVQERIKTMMDVPQLTDFFFLEELEYPPEDLIQKGMDRDSAKLALESTLQRVAGLDVWSTESLEGEIRPLAEELNVKTGQLFGAIRVAITGRKAAPPLFETMAVLGRDRCLARLERSTSCLSE